MRLTSKELQDSGLNIKSWAHAMQSATKSSPAPCFELKGPCQLVVRKRPTKTGAVATVSGRMSFMGGEKFNLASVTLTKLPVSDDLDDAYEITVSFVPADMALVGAISGMTMTLSQAIDVFDGLEDWTIAMKDGIPETTSSSKPKPKPLAQQHAENPLWGSW